MGFWRAYKAGPPSLASLALDVREHNEFRTGFINIDAFDPPLITAAGRSPAHARCSHSTYVEPDLFFYMFSKTIKNATNIFSEMFNIC